MIIFQIIAVGALGERPKNSGKPVNVDFPFCMLVDYINMQLTDLGTRDTGTFDIREVMYIEIRSCDIFITDFTGTFEFLLCS